MNFRPSLAMAALGRRITTPSRMLLCGVVAASLLACGGGGSDSPAAGGGAGAGAPDLTALAGTYALKTGGTAVGSFMLDQSASVTVCAIGTEVGCTAEVTAPTAAGGSTQFKLKGVAGGSAASGTIAADGTVAGQLTKASGAAEPFTGTKVSANFSDCQTPFTRVNGQCLPPATGVVIAPSIVWKLEVSAAGRTYTMQLCHSPLGLDCTAVSDPIFVSKADLADDETPDIIEYAESVAKEFQNMVGRLWAAKTYPTLAQLVSIFKKAVDTAIATDSPNAVETAGAGFTAAGFPAATGGASSGPSGTASSAESACANQTYPGDTSEPQVYLFDKLAQFDACLYKATNKDIYLTDGNTQCRVLDGLLKATIGTFKPMYCTGPSLKY